VICYVSQGTTLKAGTVILTGTPPGIGNGKTPKVWLKDGDEVRCFISHGIGTLVNTIKYE
jgi:2-keto-4-pentenoate hydratase/2-oxohepta-3-ene-1,7-dioic acid hydratase in catechol pathway